MDRHIPFERLHNFRDLGGLATADGRRIRPGRLFRADSLGKLGEGTDDWDRFLSLGIRTVVDLRYPWEIEVGGRIPEHASFSYHNLSIEHRPYDQAALGAEIEPGPYLAARYMEVAEDGRKEIAAALEVVADAEDSLVFHCTSGQDRTGLLAALVLTLLGVPTPTVVEDFTLTQRATPRLLADRRYRNQGRTPAWPYWGHAPAEVIQLFLTALNARYGSVEQYVTRGLDLDAGALGETLRGRLLEDTAAGDPQR